MRKFFILLASVVMGLSFISCDRNEPEETSDFTIILSNITSTSVDYRIEPKDQNATYVINLNGGASWTDEQMLTELKNAYDLIIKYNPEVTGYDYFLKTGTYEGSFNDLTSGKKYMLMVIPMDAEGNFNGNIVRKEFVTTL